MDDLTADDHSVFVEIPYKVFMYTLDQVAWMLSMDEEYIRKKLTFYPGRSYGQPKPAEFKAVNLAGPKESPIWRISEDELIRWCRRRGIKMKAERRPYR